MKVWMSFTGVVFLLLIIVFGFSLSRNIIGTYEKLIFWMLYLISIGTTAILIYGFYINRSLKNLRGPRGPRGEPGDSGEQGITGLCDPNCRNKICDITILKAIGRKLGQLERERKGEIISDDEKKAIDYIFYYDSLNLTSDEIQEKMTQNIKENKLKNNSEFISIEYIKKTLSDVNTENNIEVTNLYIKEKVKSMCHSKQFKELSPVRGPQKLIEYLKDIWVDWAELIYNAGGGVEYFTTVGAENDFEWVKNNPFNELKRYDVFYWGLPSSGRPRAVPVKPKYEKKVEPNENVDVDEGFSNYEKMEQSEIITPDKPSNETRLKLLTTNDYFFTYDDNGTKMYPNMRTYRAYSHEYEDEKYYPLGDISVAPTNKFQNAGDKFHFGVYDPSDVNNTGEPLDNISKSIGKTVGPNVDTVLVAGDVKLPSGYKKIWDDTQDKQERHRTRNAKRFGRHRGVVFRPECPEGYGALGHVFSSRRRVPPELLENIDLNADGRPKGDNQPVCIPEDCIERVPRKPSEIWDTRDSKRSGAIHTYRKKWGYKRVYSFNKLNKKDKKYKPATQDNAYNLLVMRKQGSKKSKYKHKQRYINRIKESCIAKRFPVDAKNDNNNDNLVEKPQFIIKGDDYQFPNIMKEDKYGYSEEDKMVYFIDENNNSNINSNNNMYDDSYNIMPFINSINDKFKKNKSFSDNDIILIVDKNNQIKSTIDKVDKNIIVEYIGFLSSMPSTSRYDNIHKDKEDIYNMLMDSIKDVNNAQNNNIKNKLGLGWENIPRMDNSSGNYSIHDFFYIQNKGLLKHSVNTNLKLTFELVKNPNFYTLFLNNYGGVYLKQMDNKNIELVAKDNITELELKNDNRFHFKIKLTGNKLKEVLIYDNNNSDVLNHELGSDVNSPLFAMKGNILGGHLSKLFIIE